MTNRDVIKLFFLVLLFIAATLLSYYFGGSGQLDPNSEAGHFVFSKVRLPKTLTAIIAGCTLSVSGMILQVIFRNPLAGPYVLGVSSGASLAVAASLLAVQHLAFFSGWLQGKMLTVMVAVCGSFAVTIFILAVARRISSNVVLLLIGLMIAQICGALEMALEYFADPYNLKTFVIWNMGSLGHVSVQDIWILLPFSLLLLLLLLPFVKTLDALLLGASYAQNLGIDFKRSRFMLILISSALTGITTAFCGPLAFVGIAIPVLSRMIFSSSSQVLHFFSCMLNGSILLLLADALTHQVVPGAALPVNMITTIIGAPLVILMMFRSKQW